MDEEEIEAELRAGDASDEDEADEADAEEVACDRCGDFHDAAALIAFDGGDVCEACIKASCDKPWSPKLIGGLSFLLGFGAAGVVHELNQPRLGRTVKVAPRAAAWVIAFIAVITLFAFVPDQVGHMVGIGLNVGALLFFSRAGAQRFETFKANGGETGSGWAAAGIAVGTLLTCLVVMFVTIFVYSNQRFEQAQAMLDEGDLDGASEIFDEECEAGEPAACTNRGWIAEQQGDETSARRYYRQACDADEPSGCNNLGVLYDEGRGGIADPNDARSLYRRACDLGEPLGCDNLAGSGG